LSFVKGKQCCNHLMALFEKGAYASVAWAHTHTHTHTHTYTHTNAHTHTHKHTPEHLNGILKGSFHTCMHKHMCTFCYARSQAPSALLPNKHDNPQFMAYLHLCAHKRTTHTDIHRHTRTENAPCYVCSHSPTALLPGKPLTVRALSNGLRNPTWNRKDSHVVRVTVELNNLMEVRSWMFFIHV